MRTATQEENSQLNVRENRRTKISKPTTKPTQKTKKMSNTDPTKYNQPILYCNGETDLITKK